MAETIKSFIDKLQADGVAAGQQAAEQIRAQAEAQAKQILNQARQEAEQIIAQAKAESENVRTRVQTELKLAARDTVLRLQEALTAAVHAVLTLAVKSDLGDSDFLKRLLQDVILQYVQADSQHISTIEINVSPQMREQLVQWAVQTLDKTPQLAGKVSDLKGTLAEAGFEYKISDGTVEVTTDSVVHTLLELVRPEVRRIVQEAVAQHAGEPASP